MIAYAAGAVLTVFVMIGLPLLVAFAWALLADRRPPLSRYCGGCCAEPGEPCRPACLEWLR